MRERRGVTARLIRKITTNGFPDGCLLKMPTDATVAETKQIMAQQLSLNDYKNIQLIYQGNSIQDDTLLLIDFGVTDGDLLTCTINEEPKQLDNILEIGAQRAQTRHTTPNWEAIEKAQELARQNIPETFTNALMLYIDIKLKDIEIKAFVDTGAEKTIVTEDCMKRCGLADLVDPTFSGSAAGVGEAQILGRVHYVKIEIAGQEYASSLSVLRESGGSKQADILIGLDFLRKHRCTVNLNTHALDIASTSIQVPFLTEAELPQHLRPIK